MLYRSSSLFGSRHDPHACFFSIACTTGATTLCDLGFGMSQRITLKVIARSKRTAVELVDGIYRVHVTAPPVEGAANKAVVEALAKHFSKPKKKVRLLPSEPRLTSPPHLNTCVSHRHPSARFYAPSAGCHCSWGNQQHKVR
jgi:hypothetical protein